MTLLLFAKCFAAHSFSFCILGGTLWPIKCLSFSQYVFLALPDGADSNQTVGNIYSIPSTFFLPPVGNNTVTAHRWYVKLSAAFPSPTLSGPRHWVRRGAKGPTRTLQSRLTALAFKQTHLRRTLFPWRTWRRVAVSLGPFRPL